MKQTDTHHSERFYLISIWVNIWFKSDLDWVTLCSILWEGLNITEELYVKLELNRNLCSCGLKNHYFGQHYITVKLAWRWISQQSSYATVHRSDDWSLESPQCPLQLGRLKCNYVLLIQEQATETCLIRPPGLHHVWIHSIHGEEGLFTNGSAANACHDLIWFCDSLLYCIFALVIHTNIIQIQ